MRRAPLAALLAVALLAPALLRAQEDDKAKAASARIDALDAKIGGLHKAGRYAEAKPLAEEAVRVAEDGLGPDHPRTAQTLNNLAMVLQAMGDLQGARPLVERSLAIRERALGPDHPDTALTLVNLAGVLRDLGDLKGAKPLLERSLAINEKVLGPDHPATAMSLNNLAMVLQAMADLKGARPLFERALAIREKALGAEHPGTANTLNNLASVLQALGELKEARVLYERALAINEKALGPDHPGTAASLNNLAGLLQDMGDFKGARPLIERALAIYEKALGPSHPSTAAILDNLGGVFQSMGDLRGARPLFERVVVIREKALGRDHPDTATSLNNLAGVLQAMGDLKAARPLYERSLAIRERVFGPDHTETAESLNNLAGVLVAMGDTKGARPLYERALAIDEKALGPDHPATATIVNSLAYVFNSLGDRKGARSLYERALRIREKALGPDHPDIAASLNNLACVLMAMGDLEAARPLHERAVAIYERAVGHCHPDTAASLNNLAELLQTIGDSNGAKQLYARAWDINRKQLLALLPVVSTRERCFMVQEHSLRLCLYLRGFYDEPQKTYEASLVWKGAALRASAAAQRLPASAPAEARRMYDSLADARRGLARLALSPSAPKEGEPSVAERYEEARKKVEGLERKLAEALPDFAARAFLEVGLEDVRKALPEGAALLDTLENRGNLHAWVVRPSGEVKYFALGKAGEIEPLVARFREAIEKDDEKGWKEAGRALRERIEKPLAAAMEGTKTLYVSPDGALATIPWGLLPEGDGFLIERLSIVCVSGGGAGLVMATRTPRNQSAEGLLCVGDVDYEHAEGASGKGTRPEQQAPALPHTKAEAEEVAKHFAEQFPKGASHVLSGQIATVARFEKLAPSARYVHVATHGYFDLEHLRVATGGTRGFSAPMTATPLPKTMESRRDSIGGWNPLLLSGMVFAGANAGDGGNGGDGLLTAEELQGIELTGTDLVVLSACETGRGELAAGEGVLGLSRALFVAGAKGFMLSLWEVPDQETRVLMDGFYTEFWGGTGAPTRGAPTLPEEALRSTQLRMLARDREAKAFHPHAWGAWVVMR